MKNTQKDRESIETTLKRIGACGMGYPSSGLHCIRPKGHDSPISRCFALVEETEGNVWGVWMDQDGKTWTQSLTQFPTDIVVSKPLVKSIKRNNLLDQKGSPIPDRRGAIAHTKAKS